MFGPGCKASSSKLNALQVSWAAFRVESPSWCPCAVTGHRCTSSEPLGLKGKYRLGSVTYKATATFEQAVRGGSALVNESTRALIASLQEDEVEGPRLTGLEFLWFGKGERLASDYQNRAAMDLEASAAALVAVVSEDAKLSSTGPESLRRVATRFDLEADRTAGAIIGTAGSPTAGPFAAKRRIVALRSLAVSFAAAALAVRDWKQRSQSIVAVDTHVASK
jgi:hypothetical protein